MSHRFIVYLVANYAYRYIYILTEFPITIFGKIETEHFVFNDVIHQPVQKGTLTPRPSNYRL